MEKISDLKKYLKAFKNKDKEWEELCIRCGGCCGAYDDPCSHLKKIGKNKFYCETYETRFGDQFARSGEEFDCVSVKKIIHTHWRNDHLCNCKKYLRMPLGVGKK